MQQEQSEIAIGNLVLVQPGVYTTERKQGRIMPLVIRIKSPQVGLVVESLQTTQKIVFVMGDYSNFIFVGNHAMKKIGDTDDQ